MEITRQLRQAIANDNSQIRSIEVTYNNGESVTGFIKKASFDELNVTICQHEVQRGANPYHQITFNNVIELKLVYENGEEKIFN